MGALFSRDRKTALAEWWWTVDREMLVALALLLTAGMVLSFAASPPVAERLGLEPWHFVVRHAMFLVPAVAVLIGTSMLPARAARISALIILVVSVLMLWATLRFGVEVKGAKRWISALGQTIQPSEFVKPAYAVIAAWLFAESMQQKGMPARILARACSRRGCRPASSRRS
jgi:cell division protein FtsW